MANIKDFAVGIVQTAPSPALSGTTLTLRPGEGLTMPTPPFYGTATPPGQITSLTTSEKLLVTNVNGDTLTIVRGQSPTSAKEIGQGWIFANAMYVDDVYKSSVFTDELLTGTVNGTNTVFTTVNGFSQIQVYKNGVAMHTGDDFTVTGANQVTFVTAPATGTKLTATYTTGSQAMIAGSNSLITDETPSGAVNGTNTAFTTNVKYVPNSLQVWVNGVKQKRGTHFSESNPSGGGFTMSDAPLSGDDIMVAYQFVQSVSGNSDTVDGIHASTTPTANQLYPLNSNAKIPAALVEGIVKKRQGGSATDWDVQGTTNYDVSASAVKIQTGVKQITGDPTVVTFPEAFTQKPIVLGVQHANSITNNVTVRITAVTTTTVSITTIDMNGAVNTGQSVAWIAIGV